MPSAQGGGSFPRISRRTADCGCGSICRTPGCVLVAIERLARKAPTPSSVALAERFPLEWSRCHRAKPNPALPSRAFLIIEMGSNGVLPGVRTHG